MTESSATAAEPVRSSWSRRMLDRLVALSSGRYALPTLAAVAFAEASFFPVPPDPVLAAITLARREQAWLAAAVCTLASLAGALLGYAIGAWLYDAIGAPVLAFYHLDAAFAAFQARFIEWGGWIIFAKGLTPIPFKLVTIASGVVHLALPTFILACAVTRGLRFFAVAGLFYAFGPKARAIIDRHLGLAMAIGAALVLLGFAALLLL